MPRSAVDATRFTSTHPHASSKSPLGIASTIPINASPAPPNETPQQKVTRLRDAARRAKLAQESRWEKIVLGGRVWADRAHRVTATGLIFASVIATSFALLSFGDMIIANRSKKADWFAQQQAAYDHALALAKQAEASGTLTQDLALFLNKERAIEQAEQEKLNRGSLWDRARRRLMGGLKLEDGPGAAAGAQETGRVVQAQAIAAEPSDPVERAPPIAPMPVARAEDTRTVEGRQQTEQRSAAGMVTGGVLDQLGERTARDLSAKGQSWWAWTTGR